MADIDAIRAPIPGDAPGGIYLKGDRAAYRALRNAFNASQSAFRALSETMESLADRELQEANANAWGTLSEAAETTLSETSKDLEVLCWWVAAQIHGRDPLPPTAAALTLLADLVDADIESLQPIPPLEKLKGDTDEARAAEIAELKLRPFVQLFGEVDGSGLLFVPLTNISLGGEVTYGAFILAERDNALDAMRSDFVALLPTGEAALTARAEALAEMSLQVDRLNNALRSYAAAHGQEPPATGYLSRHLKELLRAIGVLTQGTAFRLPGAADDEPSSEAEVHADAAATAGETGAAAGTAGTGAISFSADIAGRDAALAQIAELARYFRRAEPHSPIPTLLDRAVRWGQMPAEELFQEILSDGSAAYNQLTLMTGLESAGFADSFKRGSSGTRAPVEMPRLDTYSAPAPRKPAAAVDEPADTTPPAAEEADAPPPSIAKFEL